MTEQLWIHLETQTWTNLDSFRDTNLNNSGLI